MEKLKNLWAKVKSIKNIEIIIGLVIIAVMIIIYSNVSEKKADTTSTNVSNTSDSVELTENLEGRLADILSEIDGAGEVKVMIAYATTANKITAASTNTHTTTTSGGSGSTTTSTTTSSPIISGANVVVLQEKMPEITGVIIVADGADDVKVKLRLMQATATVLGINANSIQIFTRRAV